MVNPWEFDEPLCKEIGTESFFLEESENGRPSATEEYRIAAKVCKSCKHQIDCAAWAVNNDEQHGIWGGTTPRQRRDLRRMRRVS